MKRFYNNTLVCGAFSKALRLIALLCVLMGVSSSAWGYMCIKGTWDSWQCHEWGENNSYSVNLTAGNTYEFQVHDTGYNNDQKNNYGCDATMTRNSCTNYELNKNNESKNCKISADITGTYIFNYSGWNNGPIVSVTYPTQATTYYLKYPWGGGNWSWKQLTHKSGTTYTLTDSYGGLSVDYNTQDNDDGHTNITATTSCSNMSNGTQCLFTFDSNSKTVTIDPTGGCNPTPSGGTYYAKYNWGGGNWSWKQFDSNNQIKDTYHNSCMNVDTWQNANAACIDITIVEDIDDGDECVFTYNPSTKTVTATLPTDPSEKIGKLILTREVKYSETDNYATLYGYLTNNPQTSGDCDILVEYGFAYTEANTTDQQCNAPEPTEFNSKYLILGESSTSLQRGTEFIGELNNLGSDKSYAYRAYARVDGKIYFSEEWRCFATKECTYELPAAPAPIEVYVDAISARDSSYYDNCELRYGNLQRALNEIKKNSKITDKDGNLLRPVTILVSQFDSLATDGTLPDKGTGAGTYRGVHRTVSGGSGGGTRNLYVNAIEGFNKNKTDGSGYKLTIKANNGDLPRIQHLLIRSSRNIELDGINMISDPTCKKYDTALEMDNGFAGGDWGGQTGDNARLKNANIVIKNCRVGSNGFTGVHINNIDKITFENNTLNLKVQDFSQNAREYGASAKFFACDNIKFIRNNFWGGHATLLWLQQVTNTLFYNNVFWNTNEYDKNGCVAVRVYNQYNQNTNNVAVLYNTFYLADDGKTIADKEKYDFLKFGIDAASVIDGQDKDFPSGKKFYFMYNNCYSYDTDMNGKNTSFSKYKSATCNLCPNNFWSVYDEDWQSRGEKARPSKSGYDFNLTCNSCANNFINVKALVCASTASGPKDLVIRNPKGSGEGLKIGDKLTAGQISTMSGIKLTDDELYADRYRENKRDNSDGGKWTMGALEATDANKVHVIYWTGDKNSIWDIRSNWAYYEGEGSDSRTNQNARALGQLPLTCVEVLSPNLKIIIPEKGTKGNYPTPTTGEYHYPQIPAEFEAGSRTQASKQLKPGSATEYDDGVPADEQVSAGVGWLENGQQVPITKYATSIELEYGAALKGVENLQNGESHYDMGITNMTMQRDQWVLVGPVVLPFAQGESGATRSIVSNDYYLEKTPNVYMKKIEFTSEGDAFSTSWDDPFSSLEEKVGAHMAYAVNIPDSYGDAKKRAISYYAKNPDPNLPNGGTTDGDVAKSFKPMKGRFVNESALPVYEFESTDAKLLNNSYPANISAHALQGTNNANGTVYLYNYGKNSFDPVDLEKDAYIKPQHAFVFAPKKAGNLNVDASMFVGGDTKSRSAVAQTPALAINLFAGYVNSGNYSTIYVKHTESGKDGIVDSPLNAPKVFSLSDTDTPELYLLANDNRFARLCVGGKEQTIPLGIRLQKAMYVVFAKNYNKNFTKVMLFDAETGKEYNLLEKSHTVDILPAGETEGRFFLNIAVASDDYVEDDDVPTKVEEETAYNAINMYKDAYNANGIRVITTNVELKHILVSDLMGRTLQYMASGNSAYIQLPNSKGIYIIQVVGDNATRTEKVIVK